MLGAVFHSTLCFLLFTSSLPLFPPFLRSLAALAARHYLAPGFEKYNIS